MSAFNDLKTIEWETACTAVFLLICALPTIWDSVSKFVNLFGIETKWTLKKKANEELLDKLSKGFDSLNSEMNNRFKEMNNRLDAMEVSVKEVSDKVHCMEEKNDERKRAELKDKIAQTYRYFHEKGEWRRMDKEALDGLIKEYERLGCLNSFVHSTVEPESLTWKILDE